MDYCNICKPHPNPNYPGDTRYVCTACEDPTVTIKGPHEITKETGLLQSEMDNIIYGYSRSLDTNKYYRMYSKLNRFYSIKSIISTAEKIFKDDPKRMRKLDRFKKSWNDDVTEKASNDNRMSKLLDNVKLNIQKFDTVIDFNDDMVQEIINDAFNDLNLTDEQLIHSLTTDLENHTYYLASISSLTSRSRNTIDRSLER